MIDRKILLLSIFLNISNKYLAAPYIQTAIYGVILITRGVSP